jgi:NitT/TauT family transport system ATP-binding protein
MASDALLELRTVGKTFSGREGNPVTVLRDIDLRVERGEILALLGRSGCGKSTLLRTISGLTPASSGEALYNGQAVHGPQQGISLVFQTFALLPWLDVQQNVELGLEARGVRPQERRERALKAIDMIGLAGFESAYPKELSGGMRQRVGFARALVVNPDILLMDEAFSALDVPTTETLRGDLLDLWLERQIPTEAIIMVSHSIEESLLLADRIVILDSNPGRVKAELRARLRHPRDRDSLPFRRLMDRTYATMSTAGTGPMGAKDIYHRLPAAQVAQMLGMLDNLHQPGETTGVELTELAQSLQMEVDELFPILEALDLLDFAHARGQAVELTRHGRGFLDADIARRKVIFGEHLLQRIPLLTHMRRVLDERAQHRAPRTRFLRELEDSLPEEAAAQVLSVATEWGRYAELFAYEDDTGEFGYEVEDETEEAEQI